MSAYIIADVTPKDITSLQEYSAAAGPIVEKYNGKFLAKGAIESLTIGEHHKVKVILEFPDQKSASDWYSSSEYQALIPLRNKGMDASFHLIKS